MKTAIDLYTALVHNAQQLRDAADEKEKYREAASVLCGAHIGLPQKSCPACQVVSLQKTNDKYLADLRELTSEKDYWNLCAVQNRKEQREAVSERDTAKRLLQQVFDRAKVHSSNLGYDICEMLRDHVEHKEVVMQFLADMREHPAPPQSPKKWAPKFKVGDRVRVKNLKVIFPGNQDMTVRATIEDRRRYRMDEWYTTFPEDALELAPAPDPLAECKAAHKAGKVIEGRRKDSSVKTWVTIWLDASKPYWSPDMEYRVKPDAEPDAYRREEFEKKWTSMGAGPVERFPLNDTYQYRITECAWICWKAAIDSLAQPEQKETQP